MTIVNEFEITGFPDVQVVVENNSAPAATPTGVSSNAVIALVCPTPIGQQNKFRKFTNLKEFTTCRGELTDWTTTLSQAASMAMTFLENEATVIHMNVQPADAELAHAIVCMGIRPVTVQKYYVGDVEVKLKYLNNTYVMALDDGSGTTYADEAAIVAAGGVVVDEAQFQFKPMIRSYPVSETELRPTDASVITDYAESLAGAYAQDGSGYRIYPIMTLTALGAGVESNGFYMKFRYLDSLSKLYTNAMLYAMSSYFSNDNGTRVLFNNYPVSLDENMTYGKAINSVSTGNIDETASLFIESRLDSSHPNLPFDVTVHTSSLTSMLTLLGITDALGQTDLLFYTETDANILASSRDVMIPHNGASTLLAVTAVSDTTVKIVPFDIAPGSYVVIDSNLYLISTLNMSTGVATLDTDTPVAAIHAVGAAVVSRTEAEAADAAILVTSITGAPVSTLNMAMVKHPTTGELLFHAGAAEIIMESGTIHTVSILSIDTQLNTVTLTATVTLESGLSALLSQTKTADEVEVLESFTEAFHLKGGTAGSVATLNSRIASGYRGEIDSRILNQNMFPVDLLMSANETVEVKDAIAVLGSTITAARVLDCGAAIYDTTSAVVAASELNDGYPETMLIAGHYWAYCRNGWRIVTPTHGLAGVIGRNDRKYGKHYSYAGASRGILTDVSLEKGGVSWIPSSRGELAEAYAGYVNYISIGKDGKTFYLGDQRTCQVINDVLGEHSNARAKIQMARELEALFEDQKQEYPTPSKIQYWNARLTTWKNRWATKAEAVEGSVSVSADDKISQVVRVYAGVQLYRESKMFWITLDLL